jgi:hypothetical protein
LRPCAPGARCPPMESILIIGVFLLALVALNFYEFGRGD